MTIEEMTMMSYIFLIIAVVLGIVAIVLFFVWKIPKGYRTVKGQKRYRKRVHHKQRTCKPETAQTETIKLDVKQQEKVQFTVLQDITFVHAEEK
ncbi:MAG: hypothetical protein UHN47_10535 [Lachnospiraceae bacterium]|nr:hypothetical protein [Lachnospiraceae bacterium]